MESFLDVSVFPVQLERRDCMPWAPEPELAAVMLRCHLWMLLVLVVRAEIGRRWCCQIEAGIGFQRLSSRAAGLLDSLNLYVRLVFADWPEHL